MESCVPTKWLSAERAHWTNTGAECSSTLVSRVFPPRDDDTGGALALAAIETHTNTHLRAAYSCDAGWLDPHGVIRPLTGAERLWWTEGLVIGFSAESGRALTTYAELTDSAALTELDAMRNRIVPKLDATRAAACDTVFSLVEALLDDDEMGAAWAAEHLFLGPEPGADVTPAQVQGRLRDVCSAAVFTCAAAWQLALHPDC